MTEIHLSEKQRAFIDAQVEAGVYKDANEVVAAGLRQLQEKTETLKRLIQEGLDDVEAGRVMNFESGEELTAHILKMAEERKNASAPSQRVPTRADRSSGRL
ncbi:type II toxin-antitoxin system ParD family antitoxin [Neorhizobium tomejilense]|uniref:type II toxin-antitoxin system ParD family antitoxin n=1 Tax=Neorhizobium tomejilense TaxID=2093828 RepID=UPI000CFA2652|nr:type II toxin-antitoxin system ParD family antitoxin [Neorhizobium tomejilense]